MPTQCACKSVKGVYIVSWFFKGESVFLPKVYSNKPGICVNNYILIQ